MDYEVILSNQALSDIDGIATYIHDTLGNPEAAGHFLDQFSLMTDRLSYTPLKFSRCTSPYLSALGIRKVSVGRYIILYQVDEELREVQILHVVSEMEDYEHKL